MNFWYAGCPPCSAEATKLEQAYAHYKGHVPFVGVNTYDQTPTARAFERQHRISYPSVIDVNDAATRLAFAASVPSDATPSTIVVDRSGRVAARVSGALEATSILTSMIDKVLEEN